MTVLGAKVLRVVLKSWDSLKYSYLNNIVGSMLVGGGSVAYSVRWNKANVSEWVEQFYLEFDSGSERTLAACLTHASRTSGNTSGARVSNTWESALKFWITIGNDS